MKNKFKSHENRLIFLFSIPSKIQTQVKWRKMSKKLLEIRAYLIILSVPLAMFLVFAQAHGFSWLGLHPPEIEGGIEVTIENMKDKIFTDPPLENQRKIEEEMRKFEEQAEQRKREHEQRSLEMDEIMRQPSNSKELFPNRTKEEELNFYKSCENALAERRQTNDWSNS